MENIQKPHDMFFKQNFSKQKNAKNFLQNYLPEEILQIIDLNSLEIEKKSFVDETLQDYYSDLLYKVKIDGQDGFVYVLFEHKSYHDKWVGLQLLEYMLQIWKTKDIRYKGKLPVIIPLIIYHAEEKLKINTKFTTMFNYKNPVLEKYIPNFEFLFYDIPKYSDDQIKGIPSLKIILLLLKYIKSPKLKEKLKDILKLLTEEKLDRNLLITITIYIIHATDISHDELADIVKHNVSKEGGKIIMTTAEKLLQQGKIEGKIEGEIEGFLKILSWTSPDLAEKYEQQLYNAKSIEEVEEIEQMVKEDLQKR